MDVRLVMVTLGYNRVSERGPSLSLIVVEFLVVISKLMLLPPHTACIFDVNALRVTYFKGRIPAVIIAGKKMLEDHHAYACHCLTDTFCHPAIIKKSHNSGRNS